jgi:hypothetical protein
MKAIVVFALTISTEFWAADQLCFDASTAPKF